MLRPRAEILLEENMKKEHAIIGFVATAVVCFVLGFVLGTNKGPADDTKPAVAANEKAAEPSGGNELEGARGAVDGKDSSLIPVGTSAVKGPANAPVTIIEFSEFQCPFCSRVNPTIDTLRKDYPKDVRVVFKHNPLSFHKDAPLASEAAMAAGDQGKFWEYHDILFKNQKALKRDQLEGYAQQLNLDMQKFKGALDSGKFKKQVAEDQALANKLGARGTPNFFINGQKLVGAKPVSAFKEVIDAELKAARGSTYAARVKANYKKDAAKPSKKKNDGRPPRNDQTIYKVDLTDAPLKGNPDGAVTIIEFSDFQCPFCTRVNPTIKSILEDPKYKGKVRVAFKQLPLPFHSKAKPAAAASLAAGEQGKFWEMHDTLFANQKKLDRADFEKYAADLGLNMGKFKKALDSGKFDKQVERDMAQARKFGARGTPHFFVNGKRLSGAQPLPKFQAAVDDGLKRAEPFQQKGLKGNALYEAIIAKGATEFKAAPGANKGSARPDDNKVYDIKIPENTPWKGGKNAKVTIIEFSEFQCPFCSRVNPSIKGIQDKYGDKIKIYFMHQPLPFHKDAPLAAEASLAAHDQGKFWEYHDVLFQNQKALKREDLEKYAEQLGLNMTKFKSALDQGTFTEKVKADQTIGRANGANGTPTFFINGKKLVGAQPQAAFEAKIDAALKGK
jgi:protein-disulfide isomerase